MTGLYWTRILTLAFLLLSVLYTIIAVSPSTGGQSKHQHQIPLLSSSRSNAAIANQNYPDGIVQNWVAVSLGDEIPWMRDDLIRRKKLGQGFIQRHVGAWTTPSNWKVDPKFRVNQDRDPYYPSVQSQK